jgi:cell wall-associated NlpC family hydrolase
MGKFTISGITKPGDSFLFESDNLNEVLDAIDIMRGSVTASEREQLAAAGAFEPPAQQAQQTYQASTQQAQAAPTAPAEPPKRTRTRKAAEAPAPVQPQDAPQTQQPASPFANANAPFAPAPDHTSNGATERPAVVKLKTHLAALAAAHGEGQVYSWAIQNAFNLPVETTKDVFLNEKIYGFTDDRLEAAYRMSGGQ